MSEYGNGYDSNNMMGSTNFNDLINSYDYKSSRNKIFKPQNQEFRWKELMRLNPEYIRKTNDLTTLEPYVENILHSNLKNEDYQNLPGEYIAKLISLLQITNEYLMYSQQKLEIKQNVVNSLGMFLAIIEAYLMRKGITIKPIFCLL